MVFAVVCRGQGPFIQEKSLAGVMRMAVEVWGSLNKSLGGVLRRRRRRENFFEVHVLVLVCDAAGVAKIFFEVFSL